MWRKIKPLESASRGPTHVGFGQRVARNRSAEPSMIEFALHRPQTCFDVAQ